MKKTGIVVVALALAMFLIGALWPEEAFEEKGFIRAGVAITDVKRDRQASPSPAELDRQADVQSEQLYERLEVRGRHFIMAGSFLFPLGCALWLIGWQLAWSRQQA